MRKLVMIAALFVLPAAVACSGEDAPNDSALANEAAPAAEAAHLQPQIRVTARGRNLHAAGKDWDNAAQTEVVSPELDTSVPGRVALEVGPFKVPGPPDLNLKTKVDMAASAPGEEGDLRRIHVDRTGNTPGGEIVVLGFYDELLSEAAAAGQAYSCSKCGNVTVCGVAPGCP